MDSTATDARGPLTRVTLVVDAGWLTFIDDALSHREPGETFHAVAVDVLSDADAAPFRDMDDDDADVTE